MTPVDVRGKNVDFKKPKEWDDARDGPCGSLPIRREIGASDRVYHYSNWKPDEYELGILNAGGSVELLCVGVQPPVAVSVVEGGKK